MNRQNMRLNIDLEEKFVIDNADDEIADVGRDECTL
jgi:hypothetical protein